MSDENFKGGMDEYTPDLYTLEDENGVEQVFELLDVMDYEGEKYFALTPYHDSAEELLNSEAEIVVLKSEFDGDEEFMVTVDNDAEYEKIGGIFLERLSELYDYSDDDEDNDE